MCEAGHHRCGTRAFLACSYSIVAWPKNTCTVQCSTVLGAECQHLASEPWAHETVCRLCTLSVSQMGLWFWLCLQVQAVTCSQLMGVLQLLGRAGQSRCCVIVALWSKLLDRHNLVKVTYCCCGCGCGWLRPGLSASKKCTSARSAS